MLSIYNNVKVKLSIKFDIVCSQKKHAGITSSKKDELTGVGGMMFTEHIVCRKHIKANNNLTIAIVCVALCVFPQIHCQHFPLEKTQMTIADNSRSLQNLRLAELRQYQSTVPPVCPGINAHD